MKELPGPATLRMLLGRRMRHHREKHGMDRVQADRLLHTRGISCTDLELGATRGSPRNLMHLCDLYAITDLRERMRLLLLGRLAAADTWWEESFNDVIPDGLGLYLGLEQEAADAIWMFTPHLPDLLRSREDAREAFSRRGHPVHETDRRLDLLARRQERLRSGHLSLAVILSEQALSGDRRTVFRLTEHLEDWCNSGTVTIQIWPALQPSPAPIILCSPKQPDLPDAISSRGGLVGDSGTGSLNHSLTDFQQPLPDIVYLSDRRTYLDGPAVADSYGELLTTLALQAAPAKCTPMRLREIRRNL